MASVRLSLKDIHSSAETVLENHGRLYSKHARNIEHGSSQSHCFQNTHEGDLLLMPLVNLVLFAIWSFGSCVQ